MKRITTIILLLLAATTLSAQTPTWRGVALGADRDTLMYIIASPFDNWYLNLTGGVQTFVGNTVDPQAYWNAPTLRAHAEVGKWLIPDLAVSLRFGVFHVYSQTLHAGNNPWVMYDSPIHYEGAEWTYYPMSVSGMSAIGFITFDWTNFLNGYESGKRKRWHFYTPIGLGGIWLYGKTINQNYIDRAARGDVIVHMGDVIWNKELAFSAVCMVEYFALPHLSFNLSAELEGARGSLDDHNYNLRNGKRRTDLIPSINIGVKFNLLKEVTKYNPYTKTSSVEKVNHEFLAFGTRNTVPELTLRIENLRNSLDSLLNLSDQKALQDSNTIANITKELDDLQHKLDSIEENRDTNTFQPTNIFEDLVRKNESLNLPSTVVYFELDKYNIDLYSRRKLQNFVHRVSQLPDTLEFYVIGAADSLTGSIRHNQWLSERRSEVVYKMMIKEYGANKNQFITIPVGGITAYEPKEYNRMTLVILRSPEVDEIIERWTRWRRK